MTILGSKKEIFQCNDMIYFQNFLLFKKHLTYCADEVLLTFWERKLGNCRLASKTSNYNEKKNSEQKHILEKKGKTVEDILNLLHP